MAKTIKKASSAKDGPKSDGPLPLGIAAIKAAVLESVCELRRADDLSADEVSRLEYYYAVPILKNCDTLSAMIESGNINKGDLNRAVFVIYSSAVALGGFVLPDGARVDRLRRLGPRKNAQGPRAKPWHAHANELLKELHKSNPNSSLVEYRDHIIYMWRDKEMSPPGSDAVDTYVKRAIDEGVIPPTPGMIKRPPRKPAN
jgi:hypothetical protein